MRKKKGHTWRDLAVGIAPMALKMATSIMDNVQTWPNTAEKQVNAENKMTNT